MIQCLSYWVSVYRSDLQIVAFSYPSVNEKSAKKEKLLQNPLSCSLINSLPNQYSNALPA
jgi:hypothetical protein